MDGLLWRKHNRQLAHDLPLCSRRPAMASKLGWLMRMALRCLILAQWAVVLGAATLKDWNAIFICFWITFCIISHAYLIPASIEVKSWMRSYAGIKFERYRTKLSSRRALLNSLIALNPDTVPWSNDPQHATQLSDKWCAGAMTWIDPILKQCPDRSRWEEASRKALAETAERFSLGEIASNENLEKIWKASGLTWQDEYEQRRDYWVKYISEGIYIAGKIKLLTGFFQQKVLKENIL
jgi:hypothetical protein